MCAKIDNFEIALGVLKLVLWLSINLVDWQEIQLYTTSELGVFRIE